MSPVFLSGRNFTNLDRGGDRGLDHGAADGADHHRRRDRPVGRVDGRPRLRGARLPVLSRRSARGRIPIVLVIGRRSAACSTACSSPASSCRRSSSRSARSRSSAAWPSWCSGPSGVSGFPDWFTSFGFGTVPGTPIPWPLLIFVGWRWSSASPARDVARPPALRDRQERRAPPATPASASPAMKLALFALQRPHRGARRRHPHGSLRQCPRRHRPGPHADRHHDRAPRRREHLRRPGDDPRRRPRGRDARRPRQRPAADERLGRDPEHRRRLLLIVSVVIPNLAHQVSTRVGRGPQVGRGSAATAGAGGAPGP